MIARTLFGAQPELARQRRSAFQRGLRAALPAMLPTAIWGLVAGVAMIKTGLTVPQALAMTLLVYSGSAQMASLPLIATGAPVWLVLLTAGIVNLRFIIFSATMWPYLGRLPLLRRLSIGYLTADIGVALFIGRYGDAPPQSAATPSSCGSSAGLVSATWMSWQPLSIAGILLAEAIPGAWGLEYAAILALIAITMPMFSGRPAAAGCLTAGVVAVLAASLPLRLGLLLAVIAGVAVAMTIDSTGEADAERRPMMSSAEIWLTIGGLALLTFITRNAFLMLGQRVALPERLQHALRYAPACALVALIVPEVVLQSGTLALQVSNPKLVAAVVTVAVMVATRRAFAGIALGMLAYTLIRLL